MPSRILASILIATGLLFGTQARSQNLSGQWTGGFLTTGDLWGGKTEYVLELEVNGRKVEGHSYTYFILSGKRHYVICRLEGEFDKGSKSITVSEVEKVKSNTPPGFRDLFQTHRLTYLKQGDREVLQGKWKPYKPRESDQAGETTLERKALAKLKPVTPTPSLSQAKPTPNKTTSPSQGGTSKAGTSTQKPSTPASQPQAKTVNPPIPPTGSQKTVTGTREKPDTPPQAKGGESKKDVPSSAQNPASDSEPAKSPPRIEQRSKKLVQLIEVEEPSFKVELYDNGQIDGDTVSLYFNNRLMVSRKRLSTTPITLEINLDRDRKDNELVMFAENMGAIPPNTALMVVTVRDRRYELNITSTEEANGTVRFRLKE
jgi:hypothetical protein